MPVSTAPASRPRFRQPGVLILAVLLILIGGAAAFYFGYYTNPSVIYKQSLARTGKGYDKLVDYLDSSAQSRYKGYVGDGSYKLKLKSGVTSDGGVHVKSDGQNGELKFDAGVLGTRLNANVRFIKSTGTTPDIYLQASGIKGFGALAGEPQLGAVLDKLDGNWVFIDHTLLDSLNQAVGQEASAVKPPTRDQVMDEVKAFGKVNQQYVFSTAKDKAVLKLVKTHGKEKINGHTTYHYTVAFQKDNVRKYVTAQGEALKSSKLYAWIKQNNYQSEVDALIKEARNSADDIKSSDTFDIWMDAGDRLVYKVRLAGSKNPAEGFVDIGLDYKGGAAYPFFLSGEDKTGSSTSLFNLTATVNTKTDEVAFKLSVTDDSKTDGGSLTGDFTYRPTNESVKVARPSNAQSLPQVLDALGLGNYINELQQVGSPSGLPLTTTGESVPPGVLR